MSERNRLLAIIGLIVITLLVVVLIVVRLLWKAPAPTPEPEPEAEAPSSGLTVADPNPGAASGFAVLGSPLTPPTPAPVPVAAAEAGPIPTAELFAERYGSYSNQSDFQNLRDLLPLMTQRYRDETEAKLAKPSPPAEEYLGVTSLKISSKIETEDTAVGKASVSVLTQQTKTVGTDAPEVGYKTYVVRLVKSGKDWKVDGIAER